MPCKCTTKAFLPFKKLSKEHPSYTATSYNNFGTVMHAMGNNVDALQMFKQGLTICEKVFGKDHPYTLQSYKKQCWVRGDAAGHG